MQRQHQQPASSVVAHAPSQAIATNKMLLLPPPRRRDWAADNIMLACPRDEQNFLIVAVATTATFGRTSLDKLLDSSQPQLHRFSTRKGIHCNRRQPNKSFPLEWYRREKREELDFAIAMTCDWLLPKLVSHHCLYLTNPQWREDIMPSDPVSAAAAAARDGYARGDAQLPATKIMVIGPCNKQWDFQQSS